MNKLILSLMMLIALAANAQKKVDLQKTSQFKLINRTAETMVENGRQVLRLSEGNDQGLAILNDVTFSSGTIEFDVKGRNVVQGSFVGIAFHVQQDGHYDAIYFRPFNFMNPDTARRRRAVQYVSEPEYPWDKLRETYPGKYENRVTPVPDAEDWFHAKVIVDGKKVSVFVNDSPTPSLEVTRLSNTTEGQVALWAGNTSNGSFANLVITPTRSKKSKK